jgi:hypothetical protein
MQLMPFTNVDMHNFLNILKKCVNKQILIRFCGLFYDAVSNLKLDF